MKFIARKKIITNTYRIQTYDSIMCGYFCIGFINFMFNGKSLTDYTNLLSPNDFKNISTLKLKKEKILLKKLVNILLLLIMQTKFLLHYQHRLAL